MKQPHRFGRPLLLLGAMTAAAFACGCTGSVEKMPAGSQPESSGGKVGGSSTASTGGSGVTNIDPKDIAKPSTDCTEGASWRLPTAMRMLTGQEFRNVTKDLLGPTVDTGALSLPADVKGPSGFDNDRSLNVASANRVQAIFEAAGKVSATKLPTTIQAASVEGFLTRAFRRPPLPSELSSFRAAFDDWATRWGAEEASRLLVETVMQSPQFLYRIERNDPGTAAYAKASRLSFLLWQSMPDDALFAAAKSGELNNVQGLVSQAVRLAADPRAAAVRRSFGSQWLRAGDVSGIQRDPKLFPEYTADVARSLSDSLQSAIDAAFVGDQASLKTALSSDTLNIDARAAKLYGVAPGGAKAPAGERLGILTHPAMMLKLAHPNRTSPVSRGVYTLKYLLCSPVPPPPAGAEDKAPVLPPNVTARERLEMHRAVPTCSSCHNLIDPVGIGFETYDALGRFRPNKPNAPVDARGELTIEQEPALSGPFDGAVELASRLSRSETVLRCVSDQYLAFALGEEVAEVPECIKSDLAKAFASNDTRFGVLERAAVSLVLSR
jgi:hypothetical protein